MAVGKFEWPAMHLIEGVKLGVAAAGIKTTNRNDVVLVAIEEGAAVAGVFTQNAFCAEPVKIAKKHLETGGIRYFIINSGNANACTGSRGYEAAMATCLAVSESANVSAQAVLPFSTGVIGQVLPAEKIVAVVPDALANLAEGGDSWTAAARAIMTTDTQPKGASVEISLNGHNIKITGIAKGSGMIKPDMATMLAFGATDAKIEQPVLEEICRLAANKSFNRITVDGDTSTNDACMLIATGKSSAPALVTNKGELFEAVLSGVTEVFQQLAQLIVRDGEGATKYIEVDIKGGATPQECLDVAYAIAHSPLIKTAFFASDPNWGRIVAAIGNAKVNTLDIAKVKVWLGDVLIVENGGVAESYTEQAGQTEMDKEEIKITVDLGRGTAREVLWTTDLSHDYIKINAEYRS